MQPDADVALAQVQAAAQLVHLQALELAEEEHRGQRPRESAEAAVEDLPELALLERLVGRLPGSQAALPQAVGPEESVADRVGASARGELGLGAAAATRR